MSFKKNTETYYNRLSNLLHNIQVTRKDKEQWDFSSAIEYVCKLAITQTEAGRKIIFIGDSVLFGSGVDEQKTFVGKLREINNDTLVINAAIIGNNITEILTDIKKNYVGC